MCVFFLLFRGEGNKGGALGGGKGLVFRGHPRGGGRGEGVRRCLWGGEWGEGG